MNTAATTQLIKEESKQLGFGYCGIAKADFLEEEAPRLEQWLTQNMHGSMHYMENFFDLRLDPRKLVHGAKSVICLLYNYYPENSLETGVRSSETVKNKENARLRTSNSELRPKISKYAYGKDYHFVIKEKLKELLHFIRKKTGDVNGRCFVDSAPVLERAWAAKSGLGWIGKNSNLINKQSGSFFFVAEIILDLELEYDNPIEDFCGTCTRCIDACPTDAIIKPQVVDGSKCISYFTIELKENFPIPPSMKGKFRDWVFGCDICQDVCPWNRFSKPHHEKQFVPSEELLGMKPGDWKEITEEVFEKVFKNSAVKRAGFRGLKRNIEFAGKN
ncbi:MAG TPA: tRNA epoxyqueuosine(34) reductase QueG [Bacteroidia bacterium]|nr:tRNA epoxyqueuosine(34) reductase QueG [Bacteroidia bacterium]